MTGWWSQDSKTIIWGKTIVFLTKEKKYICNLKPTKSYLLIYSLLRQGFSNLSSSLPHLRAFLHHDLLSRIPKYWQPRFSLLSPSYTSTSEKHDSLYSVEFTNQIVSRNTSGQTLNPALWIVLIHYCSTQLGERNWKETESTRGTFQAPKYMLQSLGPI